MPSKYTKKEPIEIPCEDCGKKVVYKILPKKGRKLCKDCSKIDYRIRTKYKNNKIHTSKALKSLLI